MSDAAMTTLRDVEREVWRLTGWRETTWVTELMAVVKAYGLSQAEMGRPRSGIDLNPGEARVPERVPEVTPGGEGGPMGSSPVGRTSLDGRDGARMVNGDGADGRTDDGDVMSVVVSGAAHAGDATAVAVLATGPVVVAAGPGQGSAHLAPGGVTGPVVRVIDEAVEPGVTKRCTRCGEVKPLVGGFWRSKSHKDGWMSQCKLCKTRVKNGQLARVRPGSAGR